MDFPVTQLMDEDACSAKLVAWLHPTAYPGNTVAPRRPILAVRVCAIGPARCPPGRWHHPGSATGAVEDTLSVTGGARFDVRATDGFCVRFRFR